MNSLDTNILIYAANVDSPEHAAAKTVMDEMIARPQQWMLADQVLFEFYKAMRNPRILERPLGAGEAGERLQFLREDCGLMRCCYELEQWDDVMEQLKRPDTPYQRTHDLILAATLLANGVERFYTRNTKDFEQAGFTEVVNPIDD